ncbi:hypothetical protein ACFY41_05480 [Streptomyces syringium]|uniref:hypothetical protein n=1 Tax=Streptomyces syringium TaxID=76729 RepID=UPI0036B4C685
MTTTTYYPAPGAHGTRLCTTAEHGPFAELLRFRLSPPEHTALVLVDREGRAVHEPKARIPLLKAAFGRYAEAYLVDTAPRTGMWHLPLGSQPVTLEITWWVGDPGRAVLGGHGTGDPWATVSGHLDRMLDATAARGRSTGQALTPQHVAQYLSQPYDVADTGLRCCAKTTPAAFGADEGFGTTGAPPQLWSPQRREEYEFYLQAVRTGPDALAALWLLHQPNEVRQVLEWVTDHPRPADGTVGEGDVTRTLLDRLSEEEQQQVAKSVAERIHAMAAPETDPRQP